MAVSMSTNLAKQISVRLKAKNLSVNMLEKEAGLKARTVQNILRGKSKRPSAELLQAIADVLDCTIKDLLEDLEHFQEDTSSKTENEILAGKYEHPELLEKIVKIINDKIKERGNSLTNQQIFICIEQVYINSFQKEPAEIDPAFIDWFIDAME